MPSPTRPLRSTVRLVVPGRMAKRPLRNYRLDQGHISPQKLHLDQDLPLALSTPRRYTMQSQGGGIGRQTLLQMDIPHSSSLMGTFVLAHSRNLTPSNHHLSGQYLCKHLRDHSEPLNRDKSLNRRSECRPTLPRKIFLCPQLGLMAGQRRWMEPMIGSQWKFEGNHKLSRSRSHSSKQRQHQRRSSRPARQKAVSTQLQPIPTARSRTENHR